jgi:hypothetical protein
MLWCLRSLSLWERVSPQRIRKALLGGGVAVLNIFVLTVVVGCSSPSRPSNPAKAAQACSHETDAARPDLTLSFDAEPADCEWDGIQPGYNCADGAVDQSAPIKLPSAAFARDSSQGNVRHGKYSARVVLKPGDHSSYSCKAEAVFAIKRLNEGEGSESWWGWSWKIPVGWRGTNSWGMLLEFTVNAILWPSYGMLNFDAAKRDSLRLGLHTGLTPNPGSGSYDSAYQKWVTLLGPGAPRPMVYGRWLDFYMHVVWRSRTNGILQIWYRVEGQQQFTKLYSDVPRDKALIEVRPHPTLLYNTVSGAPGVNRKPGLELEGGFYRASTPWTNTYWWDGMRRRQSKASILAGFPKPARANEHAGRLGQSGSMKVSRAPWLKPSIFAKRPRNCHRPFSRPTSVPCPVARSSSRRALRTLSGLHGPGARIAGQR